MEVEGEVEGKVGQSSTRVRVSAMPGRVKGWEAAPQLCGQPGS